MKWKWGNVPIPVPHLAGLILGSAIQARYSQHLFSNPAIGKIVGVLLLLFGGAIAAWAVIAAGEVDIEASERLITGGPYARSRNPMMVAWNLIYLGACLILNSVWILLLLPIVVLLTHFVDILREERMLADKFGDAYLNYRRRVRRYF